MVIAPVWCVRFIAEEGEIFANTFLSGIAGSTTCDLIPLKFLSCNGYIALIF